MIDVKVARRERNDLVRKSWEKLADLHSEVDCVAKAYCGAQFAGEVLSHKAEKKVVDTHRY